jgi:hypothetical protein
MCRPVQIKEPRASAASRGWGSRDLNGYVFPVSQPQQFELLTQMLAFCLENEGENLQIIWALQCRTGPYHRSSGQLL